MNWFLVYVLSIANGVIVMATLICVFVGLAAAMCGGFFVAMRVADEDDDADKLRPYLRRMVIVATVAGAVAALTPSPDNLVRAYVMVEGSKIVTADNATKATQEIVKRIDKVIEQLGKP